MKKEVRLDIRTMTLYSGIRGTEALPYISAKFSSLFDLDTLPMHCTGELCIPKEILPELIKHLQAAIEAEDYSMKKKVEIEA